VIHKEIILYYSSKYINIYQVLTKKINYFNILFLLLILKEYASNMPAKVNFNRDKFVDAYQAKNDFGYTYSIKQLARMFKIGNATVNIYRIKFDLNRNKKRNND